VDTQRSNFKEKDYYIHSNPGYYFYPNIPVRIRLQSGQHVVNPTRIILQEHLNRFGLYDYYYEFLDSQDPQNYDSLEPQYFELRPYPSQPFLKLKPSTLDLKPVITSNLPNSPDVDGKMLKMRLKAKWNKLVEKFLLTVKNSGEGDSQQPKSPSLSFNQLSSGKVNGLRSLTHPNRVDLF